jgi:hypothetical protein
LGSPPALPSEYAFANLIVIVAINRELCKAFPRDHEVANATEIPLIVVALRSDSGSRIRPILHIGRGMNTIWRGF